MRATAERNKFGEETRNLQSKLSWKVNVSSDEFSSFWRDVQDIPFGERQEKYWLALKKQKENCTLNYDQNAGSEPYEMFVLCRKRHV